MDALSCAKPPWKRRQDQSGREALDLLTGFFEVVHEIRIADGQVDKPSRTRPYRCLARREKGLSTDVDKLVSNLADSLLGSVGDRLPCVTAH
jgi:hypothetical protein